MELTNQQQDDPKRTGRTKKRLFRANTRKKSFHVFFSYARQDKALRDKLEDHLSILKYQGCISTWHFHEVTAGQDYTQQIDIHFNSADLILLLISASFLASTYCYGQEMARAMERHELHEAQVIPVLLRPVLIIGAPFAKLKPLPTNGKPVTSWRDRERPLSILPKESVAS